MQNFAEFSALAQQQGTTLAIVFNNTTALYFANKTLTQLSPDEILFA